jgi:uncharacterized protein YcbX
MATITHLYRYPIKGLSPEALQRVSLQTGEAIALDRCFALAHGTTEFDTKAPRHLAKTHFLMLMKNERLAALSTVYDHSSCLLHIYRDKKELIRADLEEPDGRQAIERFFADYLGDEVRGTPRLVQAPGHMFSDVDAKVLSCINLASVRELEKTLGTEIHHLRFRANVYFDDAPPWTELDWVGQEFTLGTAKVRGFKVIKRCAATNVNPETAARDLEIPQSLLKNYGHPNLGVYVQVIGDGEVAVADELVAPK